MNDNDIKLPELPEWMSNYTIPADGFEYDKNVMLVDRMHDYARAAIEADRKRHDRMLAHEWIRPALDLPENAPYRFDYYAQEIERLRNDRKRRGEPVAWVAADTLNSPHPTCVSSLAYMSQLDRDRGREYVPLYAAPVAAQTADAGLDVEAVLRLFLTGDGFIAECDIPHIVAALTAQPAVGEEIMVNAAHDVYTLPLQPSGLDGQGPRFVVHVPAQADPANTKERSMNEAERLLQALVTALDAAFISSWQSTAYWQGELDEAREYLEARTQGASHG